MLSATEAIFFRVDTSIRGQMRETTRKGQRAERPRGTHRAGPVVRVIIVICAHKPLNHNLLHTYKSALRCLCPRCHDHGHHHQDALGTSSERNTVRRVFEAAHGNSDGDRLVLAVFLGADARALTL